MKRLRSVLALLVLSTALVACSPSGDSASTGGGTADGCVDDHVAGRDYFPDKSRVEESALWDISYHGSYKIITLRDTEDPDGGDLRYVLHQCGTPKPPAHGDLAEALFVQVPVTNVSVTSFNALAMIDRLGRNRTVTGLSSQLLGNGERDAWYAGVIREAGGPRSIGEFTDPDRETVLGLRNEAVFMSAFGQGEENISRARSAGLPALSVSNRVERNALASAEWIKMIGAFYNAEAAANKEFDAIRSRYRELVSTVSGRVDGRTVGYLCIAPERGCEFVYAHGEETLTGRILSELGVTNAFGARNSQPNGRSYDFESAVGAAADADFFVVYDPTAMTMATLTSDRRLERLRPFARGTFVAGVDKNFEECRAKTYLDVDVLVRDFAIGLAPELFPGASGTCFTRPSR